MTAADTLTDHGFGLGTATLVQALFNRLDNNWALLRPTGSPPSRKNFRWHEPQRHICKSNSSAEVTLERALVNALIDARNNEWSNQVPLISGIAGPRAFKRRAIDLVWRQGESCFEFVELKMNSTLQSLPLSRSWFTAFCGYCRAGIKTAHGNRPKHVY